MNNTEDIKMNSFLSLGTENLQRILRTSCRLCMESLSASARVSMTAERRGTRLLEIANQLTSIVISEQTESSPPHICLSCAGKLVMFSEFREACLKNEREFDAIFTAIQLNMRFNQSRNLEPDDDVQVIYVCRCCKEQFENNAEYVEHKKTHVSGGGNPKDQMGFSMADLSETQYNNNEPSPVKVEKSSEFACRHCPQTFATFVRRQEHELEHKEPTSKRLVPPLVLKRAGKKRKLRKLRVLKAQECLVSVQNGDGAHLRKEHKCEKCSKVFPNFKSKWWHDIKTHKTLAGIGATSSSEKPVSGSPQVCRYCGATFDQYIRKYRHEKRCQDLTERESEKPNGSLETLKIDDETEEFKTKCSVCAVEFSTRRAKTMHEKQVHNLDIRECRSCHKIFSSYPSRYVHEKRCGLKLSKIEA